MRDDDTADRVGVDETGVENEGDKMLVENYGLEI